MTVRRMCALALVLGALISLSETAPQATNGRHRLPPPRDEGPLVTLLTPDEGRAINAPSLVVQALVAARQPDAWRRFRFGGFLVKGRHIGILERVTLAVDGRIVRNVLVAPCRRQFVVDEVVSITTLGDGPHTLEVTAIQGSGRGAQKESVTAVFSIDRTLPVAERNRIEEAATPSPFACFGVRDDDDDEDHWGPRPRHPDVHGRFMLSGQSNGLNLTSDRIVIAAGGALRVLEPGSFQCDRSGRECRFEDRFHPFLRRLVLERTGARLWRFQILGGPQWPRDAAVYLRVGDDWGGLDLASGERIAGLVPQLDTARSATASIGATGGTVQTTDAVGTILRLDVPAGALAADIAITISPLTASPLGGTAVLEHPGVHLEPEGLVFATAATLTLDVSATGATFTPDTHLFLLTSPLTMVPLPGSLNPAGTVLTATLHHFSTMGPAPATDAFSDLAAWGNAVLASGATLTLTELQSLAALAAEQQQLGCSTACIDLAQLTQRAQESIDALVLSECPLDIEVPSDARLARYLELQAIAQQLGATVPTLSQCIDRVMRSLVEHAAADALGHPAYDTTFTRLLDLANRAQQLGLTAHQNFALQSIDEATRVIAVRFLDTVQGARGTPQEPVAVQEARTGLQEALTWVTGTGSAVLNVAPTLDDYLQSSINGLSASGGFTLETPIEILNPEGAIYRMRGYVDLVFRPGFDPPRGYPPSALQEPNELSVSDSHNGVSGSMAIRHSGNTLAVDVSAAGQELAGNNLRSIDMSLTVTLRFTSPGLVTLLADGDWPLPFPSANDSLGIGAQIQTFHFVRYDGGYSVLEGVWHETVATSPGVLPCNDPLRSSPCETTLRVGANSDLTLLFRFHLTGVTEHQATDYHGPPFSLSRTSLLRAIFTPGTFGSPNVAPSAVAQTKTTPVNTSVPVTLAGDDLERDPLTFNIATHPAHGTLQGVTPNIVYIPNQGFEGLDSFTYTVNDGTETSGAATVFVQVGAPGGGGDAN